MTPYDATADHFHHFVFQFASINHLLKFQEDCSISGGSYPETKSVICCFISKIL